jgi:uncharacterized protein YeaO (DUF488 family)
MIQLKRVYDKGGSASDGVRFLVERLWPRGIKKTDLKVDGWLREVAPSTQLRQWFGHDPAKWDEFRRRYDAELKAHPDAWEPILKASGRGRVTLLYSSHDTEHNNAVALKEYLERKLRRPGRA